MGKGTCQRCLKQFATRCAYLYHVKYETCGKYERVYSCDTCDIKLPTFDLAEHHVKKVHETDILEGENSNEE